MVHLLEIETEEMLNYYFQFDILIWSKMTMLNFALSHSQTHAETVHYHWGISILGIYKSTFNKSINRLCV